MKKYILALSALALSAGFVGCRGPSMASRSFTEEEAFWARTIRKSYVGWKAPALPPVRTAGAWTPAAASSAPVTFGQSSVPAMPEAAFLPPISSGKTEEVELVPVDKKPGGTTAAAAEIYTVQKGDTLGGIARKYYGNANDWQRILENNKDLLSSPTQLKPGMRLKIPAASGGK